MRYPFALDQEFSVSGTWWQPSAPDKVVHGVLSRSAEGDCVLALRGSVDSVGKLGETEPLIHGRTELGKEITAWQCLVTERTFGATTGVKMRCDRVVIGLHFLPNDRAFKYIEANTPGLEEWLGGTPIAAKHEGKWRVEARLNRLPGWRVRLPVTNASLSPQYDYHSTLTGDQHHLTMDVTAFLRVQGDEKQTVEWLLNLHWRLNGLLTALMGDPVYTRVARVWMKPIGQRRGVNCYVLYPTSGRRKKRTESSWMPGTIKRLRRDAKPVIARWFEREEFIRALSDLYYSVLYSPHRFLESELMLLTQGLERYHRLRFAGRYVTEAEYEPIRHGLSSAIPTHLPNDFKAALKSKIKYGYEFSLRKRLNALVELLPKPVRELIDLPVGTVIDSRNYYTHYDPALKAEAAVGPVLQNIVAQLGALSAALIYNEIGFPAALVPVALRRNRFFGFAVWRTHEDAPAELPSIPAALAERRKRSGRPIRHRIRRR